MKRLTIYRDGALEINCENCPETKICKRAELTESDCLYFLTERLAEYEDAEEQGLLVWLPCKEGTWVYKICMISVRDDDYAMSWHQEMGVREVRFQASMRDQIGKTVFLTYEAAEKALEDV